MAAGDNSAIPHHQPPAAVLQVGDSVRNRLRRLMPGTTRYARTFVLSKTCWQLRSISW
ncbi:hypothetical protein [Mycobacterium tuberculosis]|uniref:hypothetical protein n=1 Tax=Mycobacterium tuberculosis TaxID=1773 RepID=UPI0032B4033F